MTSELENCKSNLVLTLEIELLKIQEEIAIAQEKERVLVKKIQQAIERIQEYKNKK